ncbi:MAG: N-acetylneuraminate synthase family protein [Phycisphaerae bacterium]|nr:N-acetylneuraminate synthase family protein [Phycisphaerae bacterium]
MENAADLTAKPRDDDQTIRRRDDTHVLAVVLARAGSKGLPSKNSLPINGRPMIAYTIAEAKAATSIDAVCVTTDSSHCEAVAREMGVYVVERPAELANDTATVDSAARHAVETYEKFRRPVTHVVLLYGNVPVRAPEIIDRAVSKLLQHGCDSVRSVTPVEKQHPDWIHRLEGDRLVQYRRNSIYRRQDLEPLYYHDGAVVAVSRASLFRVRNDDAHAFFGIDRRAVISSGGPTVDVDSADDLKLASAILSRTDESAAPPRDYAPATRVVQIGDRLIGPMQRTFIIAEAGVNHDGSIDKARQLIDAAREAGADAVKFQCFRADRLVAADAPTCDYQTIHDAGATDQRTMLRRLELTPENFRQLAEYARSVGLIFLATPFGIEELEFIVNEIGVPAIKIASPDIINVPLLANAADTGRPLILSTGASDNAEIESAISRLKNVGAGDRLILLHCVSSYPTPPQCARLARIRQMSSRFGMPVGFSDHVDDVAIGAAAVYAGACVLEKHITLDRTATGPDHFFSLDPDQFRNYVAAVRTAEAALGDGRTALDPRELQVRERARGRVVASRTIRAGDLFTPDNLTIQRASRGLCASEWETIIGRQASMPIEAGGPITRASVRSLAQEETGVGSLRK